MSDEPKIAPSSGNVFLDIGFEPEEAEGLLRNADADTKLTLVGKMAREYLRKVILGNQGQTEADEAEIERHLPNVAPAMGAVLAAVLEAMREPSEGMWHAGAIAGGQGRARALWGWQAMLAAFEKENTGG